MRDMSETGVRKEAGGRELGGEGLILAENCLVSKCWFQNGNSTKTRILVL